MIMEIYKQKFLKVVEELKCAWIKIKYHNEDYISCWNVTNNEYAITKLCT